VDAVARFTQLRLGQEIGRTIPQATADHREQLTGNGVQGFAAHSQRSYAETRGQNKSGALAHCSAGCPPQTIISMAESGLFMAADRPKRLILPVKSRSGCPVADHSVRRQTKEIGGVVQKAVGCVGRLSGEIDRGELRADAASRSRWRAYAPSAH